jgi:hypothetical protein
VFSHSFLEYCEEVAQTLSGRKNRLH